MATAQDALASPSVMCSKCGERPRADATSTNPWCLECKAEYQREYVAKLKKQNAEQAFARGVAGMKKVLAAEFDRLGSGSFDGYEIAALIRNAPGPKFDD